MIQVQKHGDRILVRNPITGQQTEMVKVTFIEQGRGGANQSMANTSDFLSRIAGVKTGLDQLRVHTHPVLPSALVKFPVGAEFAGHINRTLYSTPAMKSQENVYSRLIDGRPTYFTTEISDEERDDIDLRVSNEALLNGNAKILFSARVGGTEVRIVDASGVLSTPMEDVIKEGV